MNAKQYLQSLGFKESTPWTLDRVSKACEHYLTHVEANNKERARVPAENLSTRKAKFIEKVSEHKEYEQQMIVEFCDYWTEHNERGKKMRFEMQKVFHVSRRLGTWHRNNQKHIKKTNSNGRYNVGKQDYSGKLADVITGL